MTEPEMRTFRSLGEAIEELGDRLSVKDHELFQINNIGGMRENEEGIAIRFTTRGEEGPEPVYFLLGRHQIVQLAREVIRKFNA